MEAISQIDSKQVNCQREAERRKRFFPAGESGGAGLWRQEVSGEPNQKQEMKEVLHLGGGGGGVWPSAEGTCR